jgi:hypothetical protein
MTPNASWWERAKLPPRPQSIELVAALVQVVDEAFARFFN